MSGLMGTYLSDILKSHASVSIDLVSDNARVTHSDSRRVFFVHGPSSSGLRQTLLDSAISNDNRQALVVGPRRKSNPGSIMISPGPRRESLTPQQTSNSEISLSFFCPGSNELFRGKRRQVSKTETRTVLSGLSV
jgi:hypothetical protein